MINIGHLEALWSLDLKAFPQQFHGVVVACSGGPDSTALFELLKGFTNQKAIEKNNFSLALCHTNFGLRGKDSDEDERFCRDLAERNGVKFFGQKISAKEREGRIGEGVQEWARRLRFAHFRELGQAGWVVALAHHADDLAENVLIRMARGTSPGNAAGMRRVAGYIWRPLLGESKKELLEYLESKAIAFRLDASNAEVDYSRNKMRHEVMPILESMFGGAAERIARFGVEAQELQAVVRAQLSTRFMGKANQGRWDLESLRLLAPVELREFVVLALHSHWDKSEEKSKEKSFQLSRDFFDEFLEVFANADLKTSWAREIAGGLRVRVRGGRFEVEVI